MNLTIMGILMVIIVTALILSRRVSLVVAFSVVPVVISLISGFSPAETSRFAVEGMESTITAVLLILFAVAFFSMLSETGMFRTMIRGIMRLTGTNVYILLIATVVIAALCHLDGAFTATYLISIPTLMPIYRKLHIDKRFLLLLIVLAACPMAALPWCSITVMVASFAKVSPMDMWKAMIPLQLLGIALAVLTALLIGVFVTRKNRGLPPAADADMEADAPQADAELERPGLFLFNLALFVGCILCLLFVRLEAYLIFLLFFDIGLLVNYPDIEIQKKLIKKYSASMLGPGLLFLAIGVMVGVMQGSGMIDGMVRLVISAIPPSIARYSHIIVGILSVPILLLIPYQLFYAFFPILIGISANFGISAMATLLPFVMLYGCQSSPMVVSANLCAELGGVDITEHCRFVFVPCFVANTVIVTAGAASGIMF